MKKLLIVLFSLSITFGFSQGTPQAVDNLATPLFKGVDIRKQTNISTPSLGIRLGNVGNNLTVKDSLGVVKTMLSTSTAASTYAPLSNPTFTGTVTIPTPFTLGAVSVTTTGTKLNYLTSATGTTGTASTNIVFSTSPTLVTPILGTPQSVTLTNATGLPISTGVSGMGTGMSTFLATPSSVNLATAMTTETGSGNLVFADNPIIKPIFPRQTSLSTPSSGIQIGNISGELNIKDSLGTNRGITATVYSVASLQAFSGSLAKYDGSDWVKKSGNVNSNGGSFAGTLIRVSSSVYWERQNKEEEVNIMWFGATGINDYTDNSVAIQNAIAECKRLNAILFFPSGYWNWNFTLTLDFPLKIKGNGLSNTFIWYLGNSDMIRTKAPDGQSEDLQIFDGTQGVEISGLTIGCKGSNQQPIPYMNPYGAYTPYYVPNTTFLRDIRGGGVIITDVEIQNFENGFYAYNSDFNRFNNLTLRAGITGIHLRGNSDQSGYFNINVITHLRAIEIYGSNNNTFQNLQLITCGNRNVNPILLSTGSTNAINILYNEFRNIWVEQNGNPSAGTPEIINALFEFASLNSSGVVRNTLIEGVYNNINTGASNGGIDDRRVNYFILLNGSFVEKIKIHTSSELNRYLIGFVSNNSTSNTQISLSGVSFNSTNTSVVNNSSGLVNVVLEGFQKLKSKSLLAGENGVYVTYNYNNDNSWKKLASATILSQATYAGMSFSLKVIDSQGQYSIIGGKASEYTYNIALTRSSGTLDDSNSATIVGNNTDYVRVVKTQNGSGSTPAIFEIQTKGGTSYRDTRLELIEINNIGGSISFFTELPSASTSITTYNPTLVSYLSDDAVTTNTDQTITGKKIFNSNVTASTGLAQGTLVTNTVNASANNNVTSLFDINGTFSNGSYTGVTNHLFRSWATSGIYTYGFEFKPIAPTSNGFSLSAKGSNTATLVDDAFNAYYSSSGGDLFFRKQTTTNLKMTGSTGNWTFQNGGTFIDVASALVQVNSTTKGFLPPRMTTTQINAISSPANGLVVYNTDLLVLCFYDGTGWRKVSHSTM